MKIKSAIRMLLYFFLLVLIQNKIYSQIQDDERFILKPSSVHTYSNNFIDFKPGFWAGKGSVISANISSINVSNYTTYAEENSIEETNISNKLYINNKNTINKNSNFSVFPNPFIDQVTITLDLLESSLDGHQKIYVNVSELAHGMYFIKVLANGISESKKIIK